MLTPDNVTACLVTRGDQWEQLVRIIGTLPYDEILIWDNAHLGVMDGHLGRATVIGGADLRTAGRYAAMFEAKHDVVFFEDDDTLFAHHDDLMAAYEPGTLTAVYGHGENDGGYGDLPLVCGGGLADRGAVLDAMRRFKGDPICLDEWDRDELAYADFAIGVLIPFKHVDLPFEINMDIAQHPSRLVNQPWAADAKRRVTERARAIRDKALTPA